MYRWARSAFYGLLSVLFKLPPPLPFPLNTGEITDTFYVLNKHWLISYMQTYIMFSSSWMSSWSRGSPVRWDQWHDWHSLVRFTIILVHFLKTSLLSFFLFVLEWLMDSLSLSHKYHINTSLQGHVFCGDHHIWRFWRYRCSVLCTNWSWT